MSLDLDCTSTIRAFNQWCLVGDCEKLRRLVASAERWLLPTSGRWRGWGSSAAHPSRWARAGPAPQTPAGTTRQSWGHYFDWNIEIVKFKYSCNLLNIIWCWPESSLDVSGRAGGQAGVLAGDGQVARVLHSYMLQRHPVLCIATGYWDTLYSS